MNSSSTADIPHEQQFDGFSAQPYLLIAKNLWHSWEIETFTRTVIAGSISNTFSQARKRLYRGLFAAIKIVTGSILFWLETHSGSP